MIASILLSIITSAYRLRSKFGLSSFELNFTTAKLIGLAPSGLSNIDAEMGAAVAQRITGKSY